MAEYIIADTHYGHKNILSFTNRPYTCVDTMTEDMINNWNNVVNPTDTVYHLGDFFIAGGTLQNEVLPRLKGNIILISGNHDKSKDRKKWLNRGYIQEVHDVGIRKKQDGTVFYLTHYPMQIGIRPRVWSIHGHIHTSMGEMYNQINVGVDSPHGFVRDRLCGEPIPLQEVFDYCIDRNERLLGKVQQLKQN
jgi:calcineurin-like phosphoesterase family protein